MLEKLRNIFQVPELRRRILFTLGLFVIYRLGEHVPTPGVNIAALTAAFRSQANGLFGMYDMFVGRAFSRATIFALGIMPYISASIILQLLGAVVPYFENVNPNPGCGTTERPCEVPRLTRKRLYATDCTSEISTVP